jgi:serine/threonine protein phosphatase PrpC
VNQLDDIFDTTLSVNQRGDAAETKRRSSSGGNAIAFGMTDVGCRRESNQDQFLIAQLNKSMLVSSTSLPVETQSRLFSDAQGQLMMVADGMGGHAAGERASSLAVDHLVSRLLNSMHWFMDIDQDNDQKFVEDLKELLQDAHLRILQDSSENIDHRGMGTTLTMAHVVWPRLYVVHAGDTRCYLIRNGTAEQLTNDHTMARRLVETGGMKPEDEATSRWSHVLWNVLGGRGEGQLIAEVRRVNLIEGDCLVMCSDGLHRYVDGSGLVEVVSRFDSAETICNELVRLAIDGGGEDNITVIVAKPHPPRTPSESPTSASNEDPLPIKVDDTEMAIPIEESLKLSESDAKLEDTKPT